MLTRLLDLILNRQPRVSPSLVRAIVASRTGSRNDRREWMGQ